MAVNTRRPKQSGPLDQPITDEVVDYYTGALAKLRPGIPPDLLRKYTLFYLSGKDLKDITDENIGYISDFLNPNSPKLPNLANIKDTDEYFYGVVGPQLYKQLYDQAFDTAAPTWALTEKEVKRLPKDAFSFKRAVLQAVRSGATLQSLTQLIRDTNAAVASSAKYRESLKEAGLSTPFDNLTTDDAIKFVNSMYSGYYDARNTFNRIQTNFLQNDPNFSRGYPDPKFEYGLETDYKKRLLKHPMADVFKASANEFADATVASGFPGVAPEIVSPTDRPERMGTERTVKEFLAFGKVNPRQLKEQAFKKAAGQYLNIPIKDAQGNDAKDPITNKPVYITPYEDAIKRRLIIGTNVRGS